MVEQTRYDTAAKMIRDQSKNARGQGMGIEAIAGLLEDLETAGGGTDLEDIALRAEEPVRDTLDEEALPLDPELEGDKT